VVESTPARLVPGPVSFGFGFGEGAERVVPMQKAHS